MAGRTKSLLVAATRLVEGSTLLKRSLVGAAIGTAAISVMVGCGGGTVEASGKVTIIGAAKTHVLSADDSASGDPCQGAGVLAAFDSSAEVVVLDKDGGKVAVGTLSEGAVTDGSESLEGLGLASCDFTFNVADVPADEGLLTVRIDKSETTFRADDTEALEITVAGDEY